MDKDQERYQWPSEGPSRAGLAGSDGLGMAVMVWGWQWDVHGVDVVVAQVSCHREATGGVLWEGAHLPGFGGSSSGGTDGGTAIPTPALVGPSRWDAEFRALGPLSPPGQSRAPAWQWGHLQGWARAAPPHPVLQHTGEPPFQRYLNQHSTRTIRANFKKL